MTILTGVILGFSTLSGTNSQILPPQRYDEHPRHFLRGVAPPGLHGAVQTVLVSWKKLFLMVLGFANAANIYR